MEETFCQFLNLQSEFDVDELMEVREKRQYSAISFAVRLYLVLGQNLVQTDMSVPRSEEDALGRLKSGKAG